MSLFDRRPGLRWAVPIVAGGLVVGGVLGAGAATADPGLPERTAAELLVALQQPAEHAVSGTVSVSTDLGLPDLPMAGAAGDAQAGPSALLSGTHTVRVWTDGAQRSRVDILGEREEFDVVRNGSDVWTWSSASAEAAHLRVPAGRPSPNPPMDPTALPRTPQEAADLVLAALDPTTTVTTSGAGVVAGRPVYDLVLTPDQSGTRIARVVVSIDAQTSVPLRVRVYSTVTGDAAIDVGFTAVDFAAPDPAVFAFRAPPGATVTELDGGHDGEGDRAGTSQAAAVGPTTVGEGWTTVVVATTPDGDDPADADRSAVLDVLPKASGAWGSGRLLDGTLLSAIVTDDGRIAVGAVTPQVLEAALAAR